MGLLVALEGEYTTEIPLLKAKLASYLKRQTEVEMSQNKD